MSKPTLGYGLHFDAVKNSPTNWRANSGCINNFIFSGFCMLLEKEAIANKKGKNVGIFGPIKRL